MHHKDVIWAATLVAVSAVVVACGHSNGTPVDTVADPLDAVAAAPKNHRVLYEDTHVRIVEVTTQPGETENLHHHQYPSAFVFDAAQPATLSQAADGTEVRYGRNFAVLPDQAYAPPLEAFLKSANAQLEAALPNGGLVAVASGAVPTAHKFTIEDSFPAHFYRIEFKRVDGNAIIDKTSYP
jgi:hypothetical protein